MKLISILVGSFFIVVMFACSNTGKNGSMKENVTKPNIIYILADDLGYADLGCYGQKIIETPNIDRMAQQGILFTQHYSGSSVCAPSRSSLMTGKHTGHTYIRGNKEILPEGQAPLAASEFTLAEMLKNAGYKTGAFGKWGLGMAETEGSPNKQGFDEFFGYLCQRVAHRYYPTYLWENNRKYHLDGNDWNHKTVFATDIVQQKALDFIRANKDTSFFMYVPMLMPHAEIIAPEDSFLFKYSGRFDETPWGTTISDNPYTGNDYGADNFAVEGYAPVLQPRATFAAMVSRLDHEVGQILQVLEELGIADNTLVIFTSDNGPHTEGGADPDFFNSNGPLRGYKRDLYEGGIRVPMIARWPSTIKPNTTSEHLSAFWDVFPTFADVAGVEQPQSIDGISFLSALKGNNQQAEHAYLYWEFHELGGSQAIRRGDWKLVCRNVLLEGKVTVELFNLKNDIGEQNNLATLNPELVQELMSFMGECRVQSSLFPFEPKY